MLAYWQVNPRFETVKFGAHSSGYHKFCLKWDILQYITSSTKFRLGFVRTIIEKRIRTMVIDMSNNDTDTKNYWFRAQRYGWGWGLPLTWQGWIIVIAYTVMIIAGIFIFPLNEKKALFICWLVGFTILLLVICWIKGAGEKIRTHHNLDGHIISAKMPKLRYSQYA